ncbi:hypothetical protein VISI1226_11067 [Vibrio sinaloensis DSM 21326]|uniref:EamA domain-containing protein n=1 Tax=Vibrio sinaloensis DSM 21326 TaxID=945550 RepID=E8MB35_PHOS4|nr:DMT family transporter [Vibrio sinaloensis]EGA68865.1 hypothetical protein VISI1226_11067 [Vibrio sinaloensis DSM 21326]
MNATINRSMDSKTWAMLLLLSMLWGGSFFFIGVAVNDLPPLTIVTLRVALAACALWMFAIATGIRLPKSRETWFAFVGLGLLNNVIPFSLIVWGQTQIASGLASILNASTPIFAVFVAGLFLPDEKPTPLKLLGVMIGFIGVATMIGLPALNGEGNLMAQLAIVGAAFTYALAGVYGRRFKKLGINPVVTSAGQVTASTLILIPVAIYIEGPINVSAVSSQTWLAISALALISTAFAYVLYFKILELAGATNVLLVTLLAPVSAVLLGALFLNESLQMIHFFGMALIAIGLSAIDGRLWVRLKPSTH